MAIGVVHGRRVAKRRLTIAAGMEGLALGRTGMRRHPRGMPADIAYDDRFASTVFAPLAHAGREMAAIAYFAQAGQLLGLRHIMGARDHLLLPIRAIVIDALGFDARVIVMAHNHPSGDPTPSASDLSATRRVARALDAVEIRLFDHLVLAGEKTVSLRDKGHL